MWRWLVIGLTSCGRIAFDPLADGPPADGTVPFEITCNPFEFLFPNLPITEMHEPTLHPDGLRLVGYGPSFALIEAARSTPTSPFAAPGAVTALGDVIGDATFATIDGTLMAFGHQGVNGSRNLAVCRDPMSATACERIDVIDSATSTVIADDHDGPNIAIRDGQPLMTFNRGNRIYVAHRLTVDLLMWRADEIFPGIPTDDPAVTRDGEVLILPSGVGFHAMRWDAVLETFVDRVEISANVAIGSPAIGIEQGKTFELFGTGDSRGVSEAMIATCTRP